MKYEGIDYDLALYQVAWQMLAEHWQSQNSQNRYAYIKVMIIIKNY